MSCSTEVKLLIWPLSSCKWRQRQELTDISIMIIMIVNRRIQCTFQTGVFAYWMKIFSSISVGTLPYFRKENCTRPRIFHSFTYSIFTFVSSRRDSVVFFPVRKHEKCERKRRLTSRRMENGFIVLFKSSPCRCTPASH